MEAPTYERETIPDERYRDALVTVLLTQSAPAWNVDQRAAYGEHTMDGPSLDHWVRTTNVWAELERRVWEYDHLATSAGIDEPVTAAHAVWAELAPRIEDAEQDWLGLVFSMCYLDGVGHLMMDGCRHSTYGPLMRTARLAANGKWGVVASGLVGLDEIVRLGQVPKDELDARRSTWRAITSDILDVVRSRDATVDVTLGIATCIDVTAALETVDERVRARLEGSR
jgi:hypothetical protein